MNFASFTNAFDLFADCYVYGCLTYIAIHFIIHLYCSLSADIQATKTIEPDFYAQVKDLLNPATEDVLTTEFLSSKPQFESMTIRELRTHIRDNQLHDVIRGHLGKTVSNARKQDLIYALSLV